LHCTQQQCKMMLLQNKQIASSCGPVGHTTTKYEGVDIGLKGSLMLTDNLTNEKGGNCLCYPCSKANTRIRWSDSQQF